MSDTLYTLLPGNAPLLISVPHAGTYIPNELRARMTPGAQATPDTDWHIPLLYDFARELGVGILAATHSRYVVDLNRNPDGAALYAGADNTELCPTSSFEYQPLYQPGELPEAGEIAARRRRYFEPFHQALEQQLAAIRARHGYALLLDAHSIASAVPRFFDGRLPDFNLGTADGSSCAALVQTGAHETLAQAEGFTTVCNGRFKGGYITRHYGRPNQGIHALQLEIAQRAYMQEAAPWPWNPVIAAPLMALLQSLVQGLLNLPAEALEPA